MLSKLNEGDHPLDRIVLIGDFPICLAKDGTTIVALQWDYAAWTPTADRFSQQVEEQGQQGATRLVAISGAVSPRLREELETRHFQVEDRVVAGPLK